VMKENALEPHDIMTRARKEPFVYSGRSAYRKTQTDVPEWLVNTVCRDNNFKGARSGPASKSLALSDLTPIQQAQERLTEARALCSKGNYEEANPVFRRAVAILKEHEGNKSIEYAMASCDLAWIYIDQGNYSVAEEVARHAHNIFLKAYGPAHADTLIALARLLRASRLLRRWSEVRRLVKVGQDGLVGAQEAADQEEAEAAEAEAAVVKVQQKMDIAKSQGDSKLVARLAATLFERTEAAAKERAEAEQAAENRGRATGGLLEDLADAFRALGKVELDVRLFAKAEVYGKQDLKLQQELYGEDDMHVVMPLMGLAQTVWDAGQPEEAEGLARQALAITKTHLGEDHMDTGYCKGYLAMTLQAQGKNALAEPLFEQALAAMKDPEHPEYATMLAAHSENCLSLGKKKLATHSYERALWHADWS